MDTKAVGQRIKAARERRGLTQEELAALVNISPTHVSVIERGAKTVRMDTFVAIANVLEVSADSLLIDVVDHAAASAASELSDAIERLPYEERMRILKAIRILTEKEDGTAKSFPSFYFTFYFTNRQFSRDFDIASHLYSFYRAINNSI